jgi:polysaccharide transporter, PST family
MSLEKGIFKNLSFLAISNLITKPLWFIYFIFVVNKLGLTDFGIYTYSISFLAFFGLIIDFGLDQLLTRDIAQNRDLTNKYFNNILIFKLFASLVFIILVFIAIYLINPDEKIREAIQIMILFSITTYLFCFCRAFFRAYEIFKYEAISIIIEKFSGIFFSAIALLFSLGLNGFLIGLLTGNFLCLFYCLFILLKKIKIIKFQYDSSTLKIITRKAIPFVVIEIFINLYFKLASIIIFHITGTTEQVGLFNTSFRLLEMYTTIPLLIVTPVYPVIARTYLSQRKDALNITTKIFKFLLLLSSIITTFIFFDYIRINNFLFKESFSEAAVGLRLNFLIIIPLSLNVLLGNIILAIHKQKYSLYTLILNSILYFLLIIVMVYKYQYIGACITIVICEWFIFITYFYCINKYFGYLNIWRYSFKLLVVCLITGLFITIFKILDINLILTMMCSSIFITILLFASRLLTIKQIKNNIFTIIEKE